MDTTLLPTGVQQERKGWFTGWVIFCGWCQCLEFPVISQCSIKTVKWIDLIFDVEATLSLSQLISNSITLICCGTSEIFSTNLQCTLCLRKCTWTDFDNFWQKYYFCTTWQNKNLEIASCPLHKTLKTLKISLCNSWTTLRCQKDQLYIQDRT